VRQQRGLRVLGERAGCEAIVLADTGKEILGEQEHVPAAGTQRRQVEHDHGQAVVEIGPEPAFLDGEREIFARGRDDGDIQGLVACAAEATHRALLDDLQQLRLQ
jgi:hypothetical protein